MPKLDLNAIAVRTGSGYPAPFHQICAGRVRQALGDAGGLTQFGVNLLRLPTGAWPSQRHYQTESDEFVYVLQGEVTLVTDAGAEILRPGDCAGFKAADPDGHCLRNLTDADVLVLEVGTRIKGDGAVYPDIDMLAPGGGGYTRKDGTPYPPAARRTK